MPTFHLILRFQRLILIRRETLSPTAFLDGMVIRRRRNLFTRRQSNRRITSHRRDRHSVHRTPNRFRAYWHPRRRRATSHRAMSVRRTFFQYSRAGIHFPMVMIPSGTTRDRRRSHCNGRCPSNFSRFRHRNVLYRLCPICQAIRQHPTRRSSGDHTNASRRNINRGARDLSRSLFSQVYSKYHNHCIQDQSRAYLITRRTTLSPLRRDNASHATYHLFPSRDTTCSRFSSNQRFHCVRRCSPQNRHRMSRYRCKSSRTTSFNCSLSSSRSGNGYRCNRCHTCSPQVRARQTLRNNTGHITLCQIRHRARNSKSRSNRRCTRPIRSRSMSRVMNKPPSRKFFSFPFMGLYRYEFSRDTNQAWRNSSPRPRRYSQASCNCNYNCSHRITYPSATNGQCNRYLRK